jgi:hypothetical protein|tara:strand:+ start:259 stop:495 length:237 start_codon:yes stop_codon:yes gene_type:complete
MFARAMLGLRKRAPAHRPAQERKFARMGVNPPFIVFFQIVVLVVVHPVIGATTERGVSRRRELPLDGRLSELVSVFVV